MKNQKIPPAPGVNEVTFPPKVEVDSAFVKLYNVGNRGRASFTVSYKPKGTGAEDIRRFRGRMELAHTTGKSISNGQVDGLPLTNAQARIFWIADEKARPTGVPLDMLATEYARCGRFSPAGDAN